MVNNTVASITNPEPSAYHELASTIQEMANQQVASHRTVILQINDMERKYVEIVQGNERLKSRLEESHAKLEKQAADHRKTSSNQNETLLKEHAELKARFQLLSDTQLDSVEEIRSQADQLQDQAKENKMLKRCLQMSDDDFNAKSIAWTNEKSQLEAVIESLRTLAQPPENKPSQLPVSSLNSRPLQQFQDSPDPLSIKPPTPAFSGLTSGHRRQTTSSEHLNIQPVSKSIESSRSETSSEPGKWKAINSTKTKQPDEPPNIAICNKRKSTGSTLETGSKRVRFESKWVPLNES